MPNSFRRNNKYAPLSVDTKKSFSFKKSSQSRYILQDEEGEASDYSDDNSPTSKQNSGNTPRLESTVYSSCQDDMDIEGARSIDDVGVKLTVESPRSPFITKEQLTGVSSVPLVSSISSYDVKGDGRGSSLSARRSMDTLSLLRKNSHSLDNINQSPSMTSIAALAPGYTIKKKASFSFFPKLNITVGVADEETENR